MKLDRPQAAVAARQPAVEEDRAGRHEDRHTADRVVGLAAADHDEGEADQRRDPDRAPRRRRLCDLSTQMRPAALTGKRSGPVKSHRSGTIWPRLSAAYREMACAIVSCGHPFAACQARFGSHSRSAIPIADQAHGERTTSQRRARTSPTASPAPRNRSVSLFSRPIPAVTPTHEPQAPVAAREELHQQPQDDRPGEQVRLRRGVEMAGAEITRERRRDRREELGPARAAQVPGDERDQDHDEPHLERGQDPHGGRRDPEQGHRRGRQQRGQRRLVDVPEGRMLAGHDEVHLVAVEAVGTRKRQQPGHHQNRDDENRPLDSQPLDGQPLETLFGR